MSVNMYSGYPQLTFNFSQNYAKPPLPSSRISFGSLTFWMLWMLNLVYIHCFTFLTACGKKYPRKVFLPFLSNRSDFWN